MFFYIRVYWITRTPAFVWVGLDCICCWTVSTNWNHCAKWGLRTRVVSFLCKYWGNPMTSEMLDWKIQTDVTRVKTIWYTDIKWRCTLQSGGAKKKSQPNLCFLVAFTVVKWGHTEGIERKKTLSEKYTVIFLDFWRYKLFLVFQIWGQNTFEGNF